MQYFYMSSLIFVMVFMHIVQSDSDELDLSSESIEETSELPLAYGSPSSDSLDNRYFTSNYQYFDRRNNDESPPTSNQYPPGFIGPQGPQGYPQSPQTSDAVNSSPG